MIRLLEDEDVTVANTESRLESGMGLVPRRGTPPLLPGREGRERVDDERLLARLEFGEIGHVHIDERALQRPGGEAPDVARLVLQGRVQFPENTFDDTDPGRPR